jgi:hypothetical protein
MATTQAKSKRKLKAANKADGKSDSGFYEAYSGFARSVRVWFISYGIGAPVIFLTNNEAWKVMAASGQGRSVAYLFLAGVAVQILAALLYKTAMWYLYVSELAPDTKRRRMYTFAEWLSESYFLEWIFDLTTLVVFVMGTLKVLSVFAG